MAAAPALILVVDDTADNRAIFRICLEDAGYRVDEAVDGADALAHIARERPALVIMDLSMPGMDGWEATRKIKGNPETRDVRVLALSGHTTGDAVARAQAAGADDVAMKPCGPADLLAKVRRLLA
jgi:CheY-like chemotaxis protein